jgi:hypothetical protein
MTFISKSKYIGGLQCSKLLWYNYNAKDQIPPYDESTQAVFDQGHQVGELAKSLFPGGVEIQGDHTDVEQVLSATAKGLNLRKPLFEPAFRFGNAYARADIIVPAARNGWDIVEVKSSTGVKDVYLHDLALQKYTYQGAGLEIRKCYVLFINNEYERKGEVEPGKLFAKQDVTERVDALLGSVGNNLRDMLNVIRMKKAPDIPIGPWCSDPYDCPLKGLCWDFLPEPSVFDLSRMGEKAFDLLKQGITKVTEIPEKFPLSRTQAMQINAVRTGLPHADKPAIRRFLGELVYPLYYLDFETFFTAIPQFDGVRPYQQIPFQYSLHVVNKPGATPEHFGFIAGGRSDPRPEILGRLRSLLGKTGSIVSYNAAFEKRVIGESGEAYPEFSAFWKSAGKRFVDLLVPFRSFHYYHPDQRGSASMKQVLPALTGQGYSGLEIGDGGTASREYLRVTFGDVPESEKERIRAQLEKYCSLDTSGMIAIVDALVKFAL